MRFGFGLSMSAILLALCVATAATAAAPGLAAAGGGPAADAGKGVRAVAATARADREMVSSMFGARGDELTVWPLPASGPATLAQLDEAVASVDSHATARAAQGKHPGRAFLFSAVVPGSGELYAGSRLKGVIFLGLEAAGVGLWYTWHDKGNDIDAAFRRVADAHWHPDAYLTWRQSSRAIRYNSFTHAMPCSTEVVEHNFAPPSAFNGCGSSERQQYYELLGKYDQFVAGWDDLTDRDGNPVNNLAEFDSVETVQSALRLKYEDQRHDSNKYLDRASTVAGLLLVNHVISAIDAARTARARSDGVSEAVLERRMRFSVELRPRGGGGAGLMPMLRAWKPFD